MTVDDVKTSIAVLKDLAAKDETKRAQEAAKSNLEAYIYAIREKIQEDEDIARGDRRGAARDVLRRAHRG